MGIYSTEFATVLAQGPLRCSVYASTGASLSITHPNLTIAQPSLSFLGRITRCPQSGSCVEGLVDVLPKPGVAFALRLPQSNESNSKLIEALISLTRPLARNHGRAPVEALLHHGFGR